MKSIDEVLKARFANDKHRMITNVVYTGNWAKKQFESFLRPFDLSNAQFNILRILRGADDWMTMKDVRNRMIEKSPNTTRLCDKLVDKGLIHREKSKADGRVIYLKIADNGLELLKTIQIEDNKSYQGYLNNLTDEEAQLISRLLDKLRG